MARRDLDWTMIEALYRAGTRSVNSIAGEHGIDEGTVRARAKKHAWTRDPQGAKREIVKAALSGFPNGVPNSEVRNVIESEAGQDVADMSNGLEVARSCILKLLRMVERADDPREIKVIIEANKTAIETVRRIRGLDDRPSNVAGFEAALRRALVESGEMPA